MYITRIPGIRAASFLLRSDYSHHYRYSLRNTSGAILVWLFWRAMLTELFSRGNFDGAILWSGCFVFWRGYFVLGYFDGAPEVTARSLIVRKRYHRKHLSKLKHINALNFPTVTNPNELRFGKGKFIHNQADYQQLLHRCTGPAHHPQKRWCKKPLRC